jgi:hypothetical protein
MKHVAKSNNLLPRIYFNGKTKLSTSQKPITFYLEYILMEKLNETRRKINYHSTPMISLTHTHTQWPRS